MFSFVCRLDGQTWPLSGLWSAPAARAD